MNSPVQHVTLVTSSECSLCFTDEFGRVRLKHGPTPGSDYINASFIDVWDTLHTFLALKIGQFYNFIGHFIIIVESEITVWHCITCTLSLPSLPVQGYKHKRAYIATQGPLSGTVGGMWRMIWENDCSCILMLCQTTENGQV